MDFDDPYSWRLPEDYTAAYGDDAEDFADFDTDIRTGVERGRITPDVD